MIRFSAALVVVAIGVLIGGVVTSKLLLVYVAIGVSAAALVALTIGVVLKREELFGEQAPASARASDGGAATVGQPAFAGQAAGQSARPWDASMASGYGGVSQPPPPFGAPRAEGPPPASRPAAADLPSAARPAGQDAAPRWTLPSEPGTASPWERPSGPEAPGRGRHAGPARSDTPAAPPTAPVPTAPSNVPPPPPPAAASAARARPSDPDRPSALSWFDHLTQPSRRDAEGEAPQAAEAAGMPASTNEAEAATTSGAADTFLSSGAPAQDDDWQPSRSWLDDDEQEDSKPSWLRDDDEAGELSASNDAADENKVGNESDAAAAHAGATSPEGTALEDGTPAWAASKPGAALDVDTADAGDTGASVPDTSDEDEGGTDEVGTDEAGTGDAVAVDTLAPLADDHTPDDAPSLAPAKQVTVVPGVPRYHDANCILIRFMDDEDLQKMTVPEATEAGCTPCRACQLDADTG